MYPLEKYNFYTHDCANGTKEVIAISTYAGKYVKGVAKCHPSDNFNLETGKEIAATRCALKIANKRTAKAKNCLNQALLELKEAENYVEKMRKYVATSDASVAEYEHLLDTYMPNYK